LNEKDVLRLEDLEEILDRYVNQGAAQIIYSGGEPLHRYGDLLHLIKRYSDRCDQWIYSSGYQLNETKAMELESAGLNGVAISLDHHSEVEHNKFRGNSKSYHWVKAAIENCRNSGLLTALNCCPTLSYLHEDGIPQLVERAKSWNVPIVNILEPRAVGHYAFMDVEYKEADMQLAASQVRYFNSLKYKTHPIVLFPAMYRKEVPCGGGKNYLFIDYDGSVMPCPFCKTPLPKIKTNAVVCDLELQMV
jgi:MoaA/NifB/PqqE/SkfB family radical SAM enzyme